MLLSGRTRATRVNRNKRQCVAYKRTAVLLL
jgi:hypothetical protein